MRSFMSISLAGAIGVTLLMPQVLRAQAIHRRWQREQARL
jgi:hypothetical protein